MAADGSATKVDVVGKNKSGKLMFVVPNGLAAGDYALEMCATNGEIGDLPPLA